MIGEWKDDYNVGCDYIDNAHKKLFSIVHKTENLCQENDYEKSKYACIESLKYLKNYTETHFMQEEAFMRECGYKGYEAHKFLHDQLRETTIKEYSKKLAESGYARDVVMELIGVFSGWLFSHILVEDQAITGKAMSRFGTYEGDKAGILAKETGRIIRDYTGYGIEIVDESYAKNDFSEAFFYEMDYATKKLFFVSDKTLVYMMAGKVLGTEVSEMNKVVLLTYVQMVHNIVKPVLLLFAKEELDKQCEKRMISAEEYGDSLSQNALMSIKWHTKYGCFAISLVV